MEFNNAAGRILHVFEKLQTKNGSAIQPKEFAQFLGIEPEWTNILSAIVELQNELEDVKIAVEQVRDANLPKYRLYQSDMKNIEASLKSFTIQMQQPSITPIIKPEATVALRYMAADLPQEAVADETDLNRIRDIVNELQGEIENTSELPRTIREWLLDLVRIIRDSLDRYAIRGGRGMRRQLSTILGEIMQTYEFAELIKKQKPSLWTKVCEALDVMQRVAAVAEKVYAGVSFVHKYLPLIKVLGIGQTDDLPVDQD